MRSSLLTGIVLAAASLTVLGQANKITNGNFEDTSGTFPNGWTVVAPVSANSTTPLQGLVSANTASTTGVIRQDFAPVTTDGLFNFRLDFMVKLTVANLSQRVRIRGDANANDIITLRFNTTGIERFSGTFGTALATTISAGTTYYVRVTGVNLDQAGRYYTVGISTDGINYTTSANITAFHFAPFGTRFETLSLDAGNGGGANWDAVSVIDTTPVLAGATWTNLSGGSWQTAANWNPNTVPNGTSLLADFSTLNLTADTTTTLDANTTIGTVKFGDTTPDFNWTLNTGSGGVLTLANTNPPAITVNNQSATLNVAVAGTNGLAKTGSGTLILAGANSYAGSTTISNGAIVATSPSALGDIGSGTTVSLNAALALSGGVNYTSAEPLTLTGPGITTAGGVFVSVQRGSLTSVSGSNAFAGNIAFTDSGNTRIGVQNGASLALSGNITESTGNTNATLIFRHGTTGAGYITLSGAGSSWTGNTDIYGGEGAVILGVDNAIPTTTHLRIGTTGVGTFSTLDLNGKNQTVRGISQITAGEGQGRIINNGAADSTLTLSGLTTNHNCAGIITDGAKKVALTLNSAGWIQTLSGTNTYTGDTTITAGTLLVAGSLGSTAVAVNGGTLAGNGTINGTVTVQSGGAISPSGTFPATLTVSNTLSLAGTGNFRINATQCDKVQGVTTFTSGGTLNVTLDSGTLSGGETFTLVTAATYGGTAPTVGTMPALGSGLNWYLDRMPVDGTIVVNRAPTGSDFAISVAQGDSSTVTIIGGKFAPTDADAGDVSNLTVSSKTDGANGTVTIVGGTNVTYTASASYSGSDSFTYTVSDQRGGTVTQTVTVTVTAGGNGANITGVTVTLPTATVTALGIPGAIYSLQYTDSLTPVNWQDITGNATASGTGALTLTDPAAANPGPRYYRTKYVSGP